MSLTALALAFVGASADCLRSCNNTLNACHWNQVVDQSVCNDGMGACVENCYSQSSNSSSPTYASNCTGMLPYIGYLDNYTASEMMTNCMYKAFAPKTPYWSSWDCTNNCDQASTLCSWNLTKYINYYECKNQTDSCYYDCFLYDYSH